MTDGVLLAMTNGQPGREQEFESWYASQHLSDVVGVPSVSRGTLHTVSDGQQSRWRHAAVYEVEGDPVAALSQVFEYAVAGKVAPPEAIDQSTVLMTGAVPITERIGAPHDPENFLFLVLTNPVDGQEDEYNRWYNDEHIDDVLAVPGFVGVQRFRLTPHPAMPAPDWRYLAFYEVDRTKVREAFEELGARGGTERMPVSPALSQEGIQIALYQPVAVKTKSS